MSASAFAPTLGARDWIPAATTAQFSAPAEGLAGCNTRPRAVGGQPNPSRRRVAGIRGRARGGRSRQRARQRSGRIAAWSLSRGHVAPLPCAAGILPLSAAQFVAAPELRLGRPARHW